MLVGEALTGAARMPDITSPVTVMPWAAADFGDASSVAVDGGRGAEGGADHGLKDEGGDGCGVVEREKTSRSSAHARLHSGYVLPNGQ